MDLLTSGALFGFRPGLVKPMGTDVLLDGAGRVVSRASYLVTVGTHVQVTVAASGISYVLSSRWVFVAPAERRTPVPRADRTVVLLALAGIAAAPTIVAAIWTT